MAATASVSKAIFSQNMLEVHSHIYFAYGCSIPLGFELFSYPLA